MKRVLGLFFLVWVNVFLSGCGSPFAPVILAPADVPVISSPQELPAELCNPDSGQVLDIVPFWTSYLRICTAEHLDFPKTPEYIDYTFSDFSKDWHYYVYHRFVQGDIGLIDLRTGKLETLVRKAESFPDAVTFGGVNLAPDGKTIVFQVDWPHETDLVKMDLETRHMQRLHTNVLITGFNGFDISKNGEIVVTCGKVSGTKPVSELCLLDENGKFIRYLTAEGYPWPGKGYFTPNGEWVVYESRYKLYKVRIDGSERQEVSPCGWPNEPSILLDDYLVTYCTISQKPNCAALFISKLDGSDFRRIGYIEPHCEQESQP